MSDLSNTFLEMVRQAAAIAQAGIPTRRFCDDCGGITTHIITQTPLENGAVAENIKCLVCKREMSSVTG